MMDSTVTQSCTDEDEEILQRVLAYKFEGVDDSYMWEGADEKERRAMVKAIREAGEDKEGLVPPLATQVAPNQG